MSKQFSIWLYTLAVLVTAGCGKQTQSSVEQPPRAASQDNTNPAIAVKPMSIADSNSQSVQIAPVPSAAITEKAAVELARKTVSGKIQINPGAKVTFEKTNDQLVVTFGGPPPAGTRGADYDARVFINPVTGKVEKWLVGP